jgi:DNA-directed RNA polymerase specialized sigma24 family protein
MELPSHRTEWVLTNEAFDRLLEQLDSDRDRAAEKYEQIRQRLMKLFKWRGCLAFEEYTDRTIDRVARRIGEGSEFQTANPYTLFHAVAMNLLKEHWRKSERESEALDYLVQSPHPVGDPEAIRSQEEAANQEKARIGCLRHCLNQLSPENLALIKRYYAEGDLMNKEQRKQMAGELSISVNALRVRAFRIRAEVEECINSCLDSERMS